MLSMSDKVIIVTLVIKFRELAYLVMVPDLVIVVVTVITIEIIRLKCIAIMENVARCHWSKPQRKVMIRGHLKVVKL